MQLVGENGDKKDKNSERKKGEKKLQLVGKMRRKKRRIVRKKGRKKGEKVALVTQCTIG